MGIHYGAGFAAGVLSTLSPCVLPLLPIVVGSALAQHRLGALALAGGLAGSFATLGLFVATLGFALGLDGEWFRGVGAVLMLGIGLVLLIAPLQARFVRAGAGIGAFGERWLARLQFRGLRGQFGLGLLLGLVWSPCVGPTLGAAVVLAGDSAHLPAAAVTLAVFGIGAALPLLVLGTLSRAWLLRVRGGLLTAGTWGKGLLGACLAGFGVLVLSGLDRALEATLVRVSPAWLTALTTHF